jgi:hypothetical protein
VSVVSPERLVPNLLNNFVQGTNKDTVSPSNEASDASGQASGDRGVVVLPSVVAAGGKTVSGYDLPAPTMASRGVANQI